MKDGKYRMSWCGGVAGDFVLYAEADALNGPWSTPQVALQPTGNANDFDGVHTCDPSVIRVRGTYYMYYGGWNNISFPNPGWKITQIGVATSANGVNWTRLNSGQPIITPAQNIGTEYGAGQPSVTYVNGLFYLVYTDTTGIAGYGVYALRSADPTFQTGVEELIGPGVFAPRTTTNHTTYLLSGAVGVDWQYVDTTNSFAMAVSTGDTLGNPITRVVIYDQALSTQQGQIDIPGDWREGPGIVSRPDKHAVPSTQCGLVPFDIFHATGTASTSTWDLSHIGIDWNTNLPCSCANLPAVFEGEGIRAPGVAWSVVKGGTRLQFQLSAPITYLSKNMWDVSSAIFNAIPYGASVFSGNYTIITSGFPGAFVLDDGRKWPVSCIGILDANGSALTNVTPAVYHSYPSGPDLFCVQ